MVLKPLPSALRSTPSRPVPHRLGSVGRHRDDGLRVARDGRRILHDSLLGKAEDVAIAPDGVAPLGYTGRFQVVLTYFGAARWQIGTRGAVIDPNSSLLLQAGQEFADYEVGRAAGRAAVVLTPAIPLLEELCAARGLTRAEVFGLMSLPASLRSRMLAHALLALSHRGEAETLAGDELFIDALRESLLPAHNAPALPVRGIVERAKEVLHSHGNGAIRLGDVASSVGCSPAYLTQIFRETEGVPLYRYHARLRLSRALLELRDCEDITGLALDLGFCSHSHFTSAFRTAFGMTPSAFRDLASIPLPHPARHAA